MPSKPVGILVLILIAGGIFGMTRLDLRRDVPWVPSDLEAAMAGQPAVRVPPVPGEWPPREARGILDPARIEGEMIDPLKDEVKPEVGEQIEITDLTLSMIAGMATVPVKISEGDDAALLKIYENGTLRWAGMEAGSFDMVKNLCEQAARTPGFHLVIVPDANVHWQWVHIALETAREAGILNVGIGVASSADRSGKILCEFPARQSGTAYVPDPEMPELPIVLEWDEHGELQYRVFGDVVVNNTEGRYIQDLYNRIVSIHSDYGAEFEDAYYNSLADPATNPWVLIPRPDVPAGKVMRAAEAVRQCAIKTLRFSDEIPD